MRNQRCEFEKVFNHSFCKVFDPLLYVYAKRDYYLLKIFVIGKKNGQRFEVRLLRVNSDWQKTKKGRENQLVKVTVLDSIQSKKET